ncbi:hypothetical protein C7I84_12465 [Mesorhizobium ephedrae]|uniref:Lectin-like protein BA14k n=2 Tax=Kumtagia ephedrae TaxID=2116701 RepID=A0A2P7SC69_9HYPH|nr:hypothetical protein C7I84_12465 [Mesorhizobium ephedrae]
MPHFRDFWPMAHRSAPGSCDGINCLRAVELPRADDSWSQVRYRRSQNDGPEIGGAVVFSLATVVAATALALYAASMGVFDRQPAGRLHLASMVSVPPPPQDSAGIDGITTSSVAARAPARPDCNVVACARAYRSFTPSDCTFQPFDGPRRLCRK